MVAYSIGDKILKIAEVFPNTVTSFPIWPIPRKFLKEAVYCLFLTVLVLFIIFYENIVL